MKKTALALLGGILLTMNSACKKSSTPIEAPEESLSISITPDPGSGTAAALSSDYTYQLTIKSTPPKKGVKIDVSAVNQLTSATEYTQTTQTNSSSITNVDLQVTNLKPGILYSIQTEVTSLSTSGNKASKTFKVSRK